MVLEELSLSSFRNIDSLTLRPDPAVNVIYGDNAQGKTNLVEAIYVLTGQRSFRTTRDADLVAFGKTAATVSAVFSCGGRSQTVTLSLGAKRTATLNGVPVMPSELTGNFLAVVFSPGELSLVQEGPSQRRAFLDAAIAQVMPRYLATAAALARVTQQRNNLLAALAKGYGDFSELSVWDASFARYAYAVIHARRRFLSRLSPPAAEIFRDIGGEALSLSYASTLQLSAPWEELGEQQAQQAILQALEQARPEDLRNFCTTIGPHRDDLDIRVGGVSARLYGSQGQQRSVALALKLAQCRVMEQTLGEAPLVLLDDVLSELDKKRRAYLLSGISGGQLFITSCDRGVARSFSGGALLRIRDGRVAAARKK